MIDRITMDPAICHGKPCIHRIVVTKDADFVNSHLLTGQPPSLLLVATGNMGNADLQRLFEGNIEVLGDALQSHRFIELGRDSLLIHA
jgi:predicted nuclease of predicted toxin-antitoxin system